MSFLTIRDRPERKSFDLIDALGFFEPSVELRGEDRPLRLKGEIVAPDGFIVSSRNSVPFRMRVSASLTVASAAELGVMTVIREKSVMHARMSSPLIGLF